MNLLRLTMKFVLLLHIFKVNSLHFTTSKMEKYDRLFLNKSKPLHTLHILAGHYEPFIYRENDAKSVMGTQISNGIEYQLLKVIAEREKLDFKESMDFKESIFGYNFQFELD